MNQWKKGFSKLFTQTVSSAIFWSDPFPGLGLGFRVSGFGFKVIGFRLL